jgi:hypothetical protein
MRLDVLVKCIRVWIIIFFMDGVVTWLAGVGGVCYLLLKILNFFWDACGVANVQPPRHSPTTGGFRRYRLARFLPRLHCEYFFTHTLYTMSIM